MKDFDDLYRIATSNEKVRGDIIVLLAKERGIELRLNEKHINERIETSWSDYLSKKHYKAANELPSDIREVYEIINKFLQDVTKLA